MSSEDKMKNRLILAREKPILLFLNKKYLCSVLNFRMWFKYGLKAQKLLAQGIALGIMAISKAPCKGKSFVYCQVFESFCPYRATGLRP